MTKEDHPEQFGPYILHERLGVGGMATVYRSVHENGNEVALKRLLPQIANDAGFIRQFVREAKIAQALAHPNIVKVEDYGIIEDEHYLAMEYVRGQSLLALLRQSNIHKQPAPVGVAIWVMREILSALDFAMSGLDEDGLPFKIVHRDLSPSNIILTGQGLIKIIDFGVAKGLQGRYATNSGRIKGKLGYMSPEVLAGRAIDQRSDLYSTAVVIWELLTARRLFRGSGQKQLQLRASKREQTPPSKLNRWVPPELDQLLFIALSKEPENRWHSAGAMLKALAPIIDQQGLGASKAALVKWIKYLSIGKGVLDSTKTNHCVRVNDIKPTNIEDALHSTNNQAPTVKHFNDKIPTIVDTVHAIESNHNVSTKPEEHSILVHEMLQDETNPMNTQPEILMEAPSELQTSKNVEDIEETASIPQFEGFTDD